MDLQREVVSRQPHRRRGLSLYIGGVAIGQAVLLGLFFGHDAAEVDVHVTIEAPVAAAAECDDGPVCAAPTAVQPTLVVTPPPVSSPPPVKLSEPPPPAQVADEADEDVESRPLETPPSKLSIQVDGVGYDAVRADGFPAMSTDGKQLAIARTDGDGGRGNPNLTIVVRSARTGATVKSFLILAADEVDDSHDPMRLPSAKKLAARRDKAMRYLEKGNFKPAVRLAGQMGPMVDDGAVELVGPYRVRVRDELFQVFDNDSGWLFAQKSIADPKPAPGADAAAANDPDSPNFDPCASPTLAYVHSWLSRGHDHLILELVSQAGPCFCDDEYSYVVVPMRKNTSK